METFHKHTKEPVLTNYFVDDAIVEQWGPEYVKDIRSGNWDRHGFYTESSDLAPKVLTRLAGIGHEPIKERLQKLKNDIRSIQEQILELSLLISEKELY